MEGFRDGGYSSGELEDWALGGAVGGGALAGGGRGLSFVDPRAVGGVSAGQVRRWAAEARADPLMRPQFSGFQPFEHMSPGELNKGWDPQGGWNGNGGWRPDAYPDNAGAVRGSEVDTVLQPNAFIDRYGTDYGAYVSPQETPFAERAIPPDSLGAPGKNFNYHSYEVLKPLPVTASTIAPAFGQSGGGLQMLSRVLVNGKPASVGWLVDHGYLREVPR